MNAGNMQEFAAFKDELPEELIRHAIDEACAAGKRTWGYARSIMSRYRDSGFRTIGDVKADAARRACSVNTQKFDYTQRPITPETYGKKSYSDPTKQLEAYDPEVFDPDTYKPENTLRRFYNESELQKLLKTQEGARKEHT